MTFAAPTNSRLLRKLPGHTAPLAFSARLPFQGCCAASEDSEVEVLRRQPLAQLRPSATPRHAAHRDGYRLPLPDQDARPQEGDSWRDLQLTANLTRPSEHMDGGNGPAITEAADAAGTERSIRTDDIIPAIVALAQH